MVIHRRRPRWESAERAVQLLAALAGELIKLIDALRSYR